MIASARRSKLSSLFREGTSLVRASIVIPFIVIAIAFAALAYRSYHLSVRMERGLETLAVQYLGYAGETTARRADAAVRSEMSKASEDWQMVERSTEIPEFEALNQWIVRHPWIISAIYLPDSDPEAAIFDNDAERLTGSSLRQTSEFFTANGAVKYTYDPSRLISLTDGIVQQQPVIHAPHLPEARELRDQSEIRLVKAPSVLGSTQTADGHAVTVPLAPPLESYAIRASINSTYISAGWGNHRVMSLWFAAIAMALLGLGARFAVRGLKREAEAMHLRSALIANVSHELRTPLSMIRLGAETLRRSDKLTEKDKSDLQESILREVLHLTHLVENVLDVARLQKSSKPLIFHPVDPIELVRSLITTYESWIRSKGFTIRLAVEGHVSEQLWDREAVSRALLNLIDNAIKYSSDEKDLLVSLGDKGDFIELSVTDRGVGIRASELSHIFEPYYRAQFSDTEARRGAGLGLTLVQQIVVSHGGKVVVESSEGKGSTFKLLFPKAKKGLKPHAVSELKPREV